MNPLDELKKAIGSKNVIIGTDKTLGALKRGRAAKVFVTKNCDKLVKDEIKNLATLGNVEVSDLEITNEDLGILYKKPFLINVICFAKE